MTDTLKRRDAARLASDLDHALGQLATEAGLVRSTMGTDDALAERLSERIHQHRHDIAALQRRVASAADRLLNGLDAVLESAAIPNADPAE